MFVFLRQHILSHNLENENKNKTKERPERPNKSQKKSTVNTLSQKLHQTTMRKIILGLWIMDLYHRVPGLEVR